MNSVAFAFLLTFLAGLSTAIGSAVAFFAKRTNTNFLAGSLGFSAGVMIYVSMIELFPAAQSSLRLALGERRGEFATVIAFLGGMLLIALIDRIVPSAENPHEVRAMPAPTNGDAQTLVPEKELDKAKDPSALMHTGLFMALSIGIHNFPEGMATFIAAMQDPSIAFPIVIAIALHNIPEGIAVSVPIYYATGNRRKAFWLSALSGLAEPLGALVGYFFLLRFMSDSTFGMIYAMIAGIMVFISIDELLPSAQAYGAHHLSIYGLVAGMVVMAASLLL